MRNYRREDLLDIIVNNFIARNEIDALFLTRKYKHYHSIVNGVKMIETEISRQVIIYYTSHKSQFFECFDDYIDNLYFKNELFKRYTKL